MTYAINSFKCILTFCVDYYVTAVRFLFEAVNFSVF